MIGERVLNKKTGKIGTVLGGDECCDGRWVISVELEDKSTELWQHHHCKIVPHPPTDLLDEINNRGFYILKEGKVAQAMVNFDKIKAVTVTPRGTLNEAMSMELHLEDDDLCIIVVKDDLRSTPLSSQQVYQNRGILREIVSNLNKSN